MKGTFALKMNRMEETSWDQRISYLILLTLLIVKFGFLITSNQPDQVVYLISYIHDVAILLVIILFSRFLAARFPSARRFFLPFFLILLGIVSVVNFSYTPFIHDLLNFPVNVFSIQWDNIDFFFHYFVSTTWILSGVILCVMVILISVKFPKRIPIAWFKVFTWVVFLSFLVSLGRPSLNPVIFSISDEIQRSMSKKYTIHRLEINRAMTKDSAYTDSINKSFTNYPLIETKYRKIIVLVMESVSYQDFINPGNYHVGQFLTGINAPFLSFPSYYTTNLDSYTSLLAMLNSTFIPYQAYVNEDKYLFVNNRKNLVEFFTANGYKTMFLTSYGEQQKRFIPDLMDWDTVLCKMDPTDRYQRVTNNKIESASEDFAVFGDLVKYVKNNESVFVFQEMVYGHTAEWKEKVGLNALEYYKRYFHALYDTLDNANLLDQTLLILTADHGPRQNAMQIQNYHVPLIISSPEVQYGEDRKLASHLDFKDILLHTLQSQKIELATDQVYTIGHSGSYDYGCIQNEGKFVFINNRTLSVQTNIPENEVVSFNRRFQQYIDFFQALGANAQSGKPQMEDKNPHPQ